jgi:hypothetical protein
MLREAKVDDRLSADQKETIRNRRLSPGQRLPVRGESPRDTEERLTQTRRRKTASERGARGVKGSKVPEFSGVSWQSSEKRSRRRDELRAKSAKNNIRDFREQKTFSEFMTEAYLIVERPYQIYGPDPHGSSDSEPRPLGKPYKNKKRAKTRADKLDQEIGGYRHFVRWVDDEEKNVKESSGMTPENKSTWERLVSQHGEQPFTNPRKSKTKSASRREEESTSPPKRKRRKLDFEVREDFVPLTPDKEERVKKRVGELARDIQLQGARMKELKKKPLGRFRPKVKKEKEEIVKSARKKAKQVGSASDALIDASISRSAKIQKRIQDLKAEL